MKISKKDEKSRRRVYATILKSRSIPLPLVEDDDDDGGKIIFPSENCCAGDGRLIEWWYVPTGQKDNGIHVNWKNWKKTFDLIKGHSRETWGYHHEYFHHIVDSWKTIHNLITPKMDRERGKIWTREQFKSISHPGLLLDEALAENYALSIVKKHDDVGHEYVKTDHPSYVPSLGSWEYLSLRHVYQIINDKYKIFREPMPHLVDDRRLIEGLNSNYELYEGQMFSAKNGFARDKESFSNCKFQPDNIPFYVHECSEEWFDEVLDFVDRNEFSKPRFNHFKS